MILACHKCILVYYIELNPQRATSTRTSCGINPLYVPPTFDYTPNSQNHFHYQFTPNSPFEPNSPPRNYVKNTTKTIIRRPKKGNMGLRELLIRLLRAQVVREATQLGHIFQDALHASLVRTPAAPY